MGKWEKPRWTSGEGRRKTPRPLGKARSRDLAPGRRSRSSDSGPVWEYLETAREIRVVHGTGIPCQGIDPL